MYDYDLGDQFKIDLEAAKAKNENIIQGKNYRFTLISERLIRMEYNKNGIFEDKPTSLVWHRNAEKVNYTKKEDRRYLEIKTKYFRLTYQKEKPFYSGKFDTMKNLKVELLNSDKIWYYGHPEIRNYGSPGISLDNSKGNLKLKKGLYSIDGFASIDDSVNDVIESNGQFISREKDVVDTYLFMYLKDFALCLKDYYFITGTPALLPRYALGNWWSKNEDYNDTSLKNLIDDFKEKEIPLSILLLDKDWHIREYNNKLHDTGFTWNNRFFVKPNKMIEYMHKNGIRLGLNINPLEGIYPYEENYSSITNNLSMDEKGIVPFNVYDPKTIDTYFKILIHSLDEKGVDFFWLDVDNTKKYKESWALSHYSFYDMKRDYKRRPMILSRNTGVAPHRYPVLYSGKTIVSWDTLKMIPLHNSSAANVGVSYWAHDIGGYYNGIEDNELYIRFVQLGVFSPILKFGSDKGKYYKREPWRWSIKTYEIAKDYLTLRHRLIPYLYAEAYKYHKYGMPLVMPIYYKFPEMYDDVNFRNGYYFGTEFFISPIINKKDYVMNRVVHKFFLPDGIWYDFVTGKKFPGGKSYISFFKDQDYPVFAKAGSIITLGNNDNINDTTPPKNMEIQIFPGRSNTYNLYEDDGVSDLYRKDFYLLTQIDYNYMPNNYTVILRPLEGKKGIVPDTRNYKFVFRNTKQANDVIAYFNDAEIETNSYISNSNFVVEVKDVPTIGQLTINCKGKNIEIDAVRIINEDVESIISDLQIETKMKEMIDKILFNEELSIKKKRIEIRKLNNKGLERKFVRVFLKILEYINEV
ncbi:MAG: glycoside hydrolase family 31 protein [Bacilli bacterium]|nr:glycoside hydrolase family 31 protein [Bacilli bacterium]